MACDDGKIKDQLTTKLRNFGNHLHNRNVIEKGSGKLEVVYRPMKENVKHHSYYSSYCLGYYGKKELWKHGGRCPLNDQFLKTKQFVRQGQALLPPPPRSDCSGEEEPD